MLIYQYTLIGFSIIKMTSLIHNTAIYILLLITFTRPIVYIFLFSFNKDPIEMFQVKVKGTKTKINSADPQGFQ